MNINKQLENYIENYILIQYADFNPSHGIKHIKQVIDKSIQIGLEYQLDLNMLYTQAAYHDIATEINRKLHHELGAKILLEDKNLKQFFSEKQLILMAYAIRMHRASYDGKIEDIYAKVLADADRSIDVDIFFFRAYQYRISENLSDEMMFAEIYDHYKKKYSKNGYVKLLLDDSVVSKMYHEFYKFMDNKKLAEQRFKELKSNGYLDN